MKEFVEYKEKITEMTMEELINELERVSRQSSDMSGKSQKYIDEIKGRIFLVKMEIWDRFNKISKTDTSKTLAK